MVAGYVADTPRPTFVRALGEISERASLKLQVTQRRIRGETPLPRRGGG